MAAILVCLASCDRDAHTVEDGTSGVLHLVLTLPDAELPEYVQPKSKTGLQEDAYMVRCVAELCKAGTDETVLHRALTPVWNGNGTLLVELVATSGNYDLRLWADCVRTDAPLSDTFYHTEKLQAVTIVTNPYTADTDEKDAAFHCEENIAIPEEGSTISIRLQRPLAKYRMVANDVETYRKLAEAEPDKFPPLSKLTVTVQYENFFPSVFNVARGVPSNSMQGLSFANSLSDVVPDAGEVQIASDWVLTNGEDTFVRSSIVISDETGTVIARTAGVEIAHKRNCQTIIRGNFLTAGIGSGGVRIDTDWKDIYKVEF